MRVGLDLDGCLYDFDGALREYMVERRFYKREQLVKVTKWHLWEDWGITKEEFFQLSTDAVDDGHLFRLGAPFPGTVEALQSLVDAGHTLHAITARTWGTPGAAEAATMKWLREYLPPFASVTFSSDKTIGAVDVMLEDKLSNYDALTQAGVRAYLINRPWNEQATEWPFRRRVDSIEQFSFQVNNLGLVVAR